MTAQNQAMPQGVPNPTMDLTELAEILRREYQAADRYYQQLSLLQLQAFKYYEGQPFGNEVEGRSQVVLPDVQETVDYMTTSVMRCFWSGDRVVEFEATSPEDEPGAEEATAAIDYLFHKRQDGKRVLHDVCVDGLIRKIGIIKTVCETEEKIARDRLTGHPLQFGEVDGELEDVAENPDGTITATLRREVREKRYRNYAIPIPEFRFSPLATHEDTADYLCHVSEKTRSQLVEMGFDVDQVYSLPHDVNHFLVVPSESRTLDVWQADESSKALQKVLLCEEYAKIDIDGDGIAERVKVYRVDTQILIEADTGKPAIEVIDEQPFAIFCPFPRPHKLIGYSLADKVMDLQLSRSFVARQLFDGLAFANMPRPVVDVSMADKDTINDLLTPIPGAPIRVKGGAASVQPFANNFNPAASLEVLQWITGERESRSGITRLNQGLDADALNKTATGTALMQAQGQQGEEFIARQMAETLSRVFAKEYRLLKAEGEPLRIKVDGQYKLVNPANWPDDFNVNVRVGLGSGSKDKRIQYRMTVAPMLAEGMQQGMVTPENVFRMFDGLIRDMGLGTGADFWVDPNSPEGQQALAQAANKPNPQLQAAQIKAQSDQQKTQIQAQLGAAKLEQQDRQHNDKLIVQQQADAAKSALEQQRQEREMQLELIRLETERQMAAEKNMAHMSANRPGGRLDA